MGTFHFRFFFIILGLGVCLFSSCEDEEKAKALLAEKEAITATFETIKNSTSTDSIFQKMDLKSRGLFHDMFQIAMEGDSVTIDTFCKTAEHPFATRYLLRMMNFMVRIDSVNKNSIYKDEQIFSFLHLAVKNIFVFDGGENYTLEKVGRIKENKVEVKIKHLVNEDSFVRVDYLFNKEQDDWKINMTSTFKYKEKYLKKLWKTRGKPPLPEFINDVVEGNINGQVYFPRKF